MGFLKDSLLRGFSLGGKLEAKGKLLMKKGNMRFVPFSNPKSFTLSQKYNKFYGNLRNFRTSNNVMPVNKYEGKMLKGTTKSWEYLPQLPLMK